MHFTFRNVNDAFRGLVGGIHSKEIPTTTETSRNGTVLRVDEPVTITYTHPSERVLFNGARDVNLFSVLYESLYMLAGRKDLAPLTHYTKKFADFSDDGKTLNGSYGHRWRHAQLYGWSNTEGEKRSKTVDQLDLLVTHLSANPTSRRAVLQMWNAEDDLLKIETSLDICCNTSVMFSLRGVPTEGSEWSDHTYLDITVTNRSNDMIWGMLGANYVTFSVLHEYMAARLGVEVGKYHQFTNNMHVYGWNWKPEKWLSESNYNGWPDMLYRNFTDSSQQMLNMVPLVNDPAVFEKELQSIDNNAYGGRVVEVLCGREWSEPFFRDVAVPMFCAFAQHKDNSPESALGFASQIKADDWRIACTSWLQRRVK